MPRLGIELRSVQLQLYWGTLIRGASPTELPQPRPQPPINQRWRTNFFSRLIWQPLESKSRIWANTFPEVSRNSGTWCWTTATSFSRRSGSTTSSSRSRSWGAWNRHVKVLMTSSRLPLARTRWVLSAFQATVHFPSHKHHWLTSAISTIFWECLE